MTGELTIRVASGVALRWQALPWVLLGRGNGTQATRYEVERSRSYRDRLVLKLKGVDDPNAAHALRGCGAWALAEHLPELPEGTFFAARLVGMEVRDETDRILGSVVDVTGVAGAEMLVLEDSAGRELLVPLAREIVRSISPEDGIARVRLPEGLADLNPEGGARS